MNIELQTICTKNAIKLKFYGQYYLQFLSLVLLFRCLLILFLFLRKMNTNH